MKKLSLKKVLNEIARWKKEGHEKIPTFQLLKSLVGKGYYINYTNNPKKIGFNPTAEHGVIQPYGYYGTLIDENFINQGGVGSFQDRKYIVIWKPKEGLNIPDFNKEGIKEISDAKNKMYDNFPVGSTEGKGRQMRVQYTKNLLEKGFDGISGNISGDFGYEVVVFKPSNVEVFEVRKNTLSLERDMENARQKMEDLKKYEKYQNMEDPLSYEYGSREESRARKGKQYRNSVDELNYWKERERRKRKSKDNFDFSNLEQY